MYRLRQLYVLKSHTGTPIVFKNYATFAESVFPYQMLHYFIVFVSIDSQM